MSDKDKHRGVTRSDISRYLSGEMSDRERNAFEKKLQRDPFAAEAVEGLSSISPGEADEDIERLLKMTGRGVRRTPWFNYAAAAAALLLMVVSTVLLIRSVDKEESLLSDIDNVGKERTDTLKITITDAVVVELTEETIPDSIAEATAAERAVTLRGKIDTAAATAVERERIAATTRQTATIAEAAAIAAAERESWSVIRVEGVVSNEKGEPFPYVTVYLDGVTTVGTLTDREGRFSLNIRREETEGRPINLIANFVGYKSQNIRIAENIDNLRVRMEVDRHAIDEVVVVGFGEERRIAIKADAIMPEWRNDTLISTGDQSVIIMVNNTGWSDYVAAIPVGGYEAFHQFVEDNLTNPEKHNEEIRVVVDMPLSAKGETGRIIVRETAGEKYSREVRRLITEGPEWMPAILGNEPLEATIRIIIIFPRK